MCDASALLPGREALVQALKNLHEGPLVLPQVLQLGVSAVPLLESVLRGPSGAIHHARCLAADGLGAIHDPESTAALVRALADSVARELDPISLEAESVIVNCIAEHLSRRPGPQITQALLDALSVRAYPQCAMAFAHRCDMRAVPLLVRCLNDDAARPAALYALRRYGRAACPALMRLLLEPPLSNATEAPSHIDARAAAAYLLGESADASLPPARARLALRAALDDGQRAVRLEAALALAQQPSEAGQAAGAVLLDALDEPNWARAESNMQALVRLGPQVAPLLCKAIAAPARDGNARLRRLRAVTVAGRLRASSAVPALASLCYASDRQLRLAAITALLEIPASGKRSLERFLSDEDGTVRLRALEGLHQRNVIDASLLAMLLGDPDGAVRRAAQQFLSEQRSSASVPLRRIIRTFGSPQEGLRDRARLWWRACAWLVTSGYGASHPGASAPTASLSSTAAPKIRR